MSSALHLSLYFPILILKACWTPFSSSLTTSSKLLLKRIDNRDVESREQHLCHWPERDAGHQQGGHRCQGSAQPQKAPEIDQSKHKHTSSNSSNGYELRVFRFTWLNSTTYRLRLALLWTYSMDVSYRFDWGILGTKLCEDHDG